MTTLTLARWNALKRQGYTSVIDGQRHALMRNPTSGATELVPVEVCTCHLCQ